MAGVSLRSFARADDQIESRREVVLGEPKRFADPAFPAVARHRVPDATRNAHSQPRPTDVVGDSQDDEYRVGGMSPFAERSRKRPFASQSLALSQSQTPNFHGGRLEE